MRRPIRHVIFDRDGVLNVEPGGGGVVSTWSQWRWIAGARASLAALTQAGVRISVATNQSGIGRGTLARGEVDNIHANMLEEVRNAGGAIDRVLVCPHAPDDGCACRKPSPGLLLQAIEASNVPRDATLVVGDGTRDLQAAWAADVRAALVRTGKGRATEMGMPHGTVQVFDDVRALVRAMLADAQSEMSTPS